MKPRDALGVIVRAAGLGLILAGIFDLGHLAIELVGLPSMYPLPVTLAAAAFWIVLGLGVLVAASTIIRLIYGPDKSD